MEFPNIWAEIDLRAIDHNVRELRRITRPGARMMAVVKADGYGHGAAPVARTALAAGADMLAVARIDEGIALRQDGFGVPILVLNPTFPPFAAGLIEHDLIQSVTGLAAAQALDEAARTAGKTIPVHLKVDSGMGRLGLVPEASRTTDHSLPPVAEVEALAQLPHVRLEGVYTHFAAADEADKTYAQQQLVVFEEFLAALQDVGIACGLRHAANSAAIIDLPDSHLDAVRPKAAGGPFRLDQHLRGRFGKQVVDGHHHKENGDGPDKQRFYFFVGHAKASRDNEGSKDRGALSSSGLTGGYGCIYPISRIP
jgi:alanine racemase